MFEKITIKEYMERENVSRTTVDNRIKNGDLETIKEGRYRFVKVYKPNVKESVQTVQTNVNQTVQTPLQTKSFQEQYIEELKQQIKDQKRELKKTKKELKKVTQELLDEKDLNKKEKDETVKILKQYIGEVKLLTQKEEIKEDHEDVIDVKDKKFKKKKKEKKSKKDK